MRFLILIMFTLSSCASTQRTDLFFGRNIPGGGQVTAQEWKIFTDSVVSPRFPEGYTEWDAAGKWLDTETKQTISEDTKVLTFVGKKSPKREALLDSVTQAYIRRFRQQAVLRINTRVKFRFVSATP